MGISPVTGAPRRKSILSPWCDASRRAPREIPPQLNSSTPDLENRDCKYKRSYIGSFSSLIVHSQGGIFVSTSCVTQKQDTFIYTTRYFFQKNICFQNN